LLSSFPLLLQRLVHEKAVVAPSEVDVQIETPTPAWVQSLTLPTINFFLFSLEENRELRQAQLSPVRGNGSAVRRMAPRRFDLRYLVSVFTTPVVDEHQLLWRTMVTLLKHPRLPDDLLPEELRGVEPPISTRVGRDEGEPSALDIWNALQVPPRPALLYTVTVPVDLDISFEAPLVLTRTTRYTSLVGDAGSPESGTHIGGILRDSTGAPLAGVPVTVGEGRSMDVTNETGAFVLRGVPTGQIEVRVAVADLEPRQVRMTVPSESYDITLD